MIKYYTEVQNMNKKQLVKQLASKFGIKEKEAKVVVETTFDAIVNALEAGEKVQITGFGTFEVKSRSERAGRNPKTGETVTIPASKYPAFTASKSLKDSFK